MYCHGQSHFMINFWKKAQYLFWTARARMVSKSFRNSLLFIPTYVLYQCLYQLRLLNLFSHSPFFKPCLQIGRPSLFDDVQLQGTEAVWQMVHLVDNTRNWLKSNAFYLQCFECWVYSFPVLLVIMGWIFSLGKLVNQIRVEIGTSAKYTYHFHVCFSAELIPPSFWNWQIHYSGLLCCKRSCILQDCTKLSHFLVHIIPCPEGTINKC